MAGRNFVRAGWMLLACLSSAALASPNDFLIHQLGNPREGGANFSEDANANFRTFVRELGAALTSVNLSPPETVGQTGFSATGELSVVTLRQSQFAFPTEAASTAPLLVPSLHVRKGLPFSLEVGGRAAWIEKSNMAAGTVELKWAFNEGFSYVPDVALRAFVTRLANARDFDLTAGGADFSLGKQFTLGGMSTLTPYAGWNLVWVGATSGTVDFRPDRTREESLGRKTAQLEDTAVFEPVAFMANRHNRFYGGARFIVGALQLGAEASYSSLGGGLPPVLAYNATLGLDF
jgi:hypothetical protein